jgi:hypothetical protein
LGVPSVSMNMAKIPLLGADIAPRQADGKGGRAGYEAPVTPTRDARLASLAVLPIPRLRGGGPAAAGRAP